MRERKDLENNKKKQLLSMLIYSKESSRSCRDVFPIYATSLLKASIINIIIIFVVLLLTFPLPKNS